MNVLLDEVGWCNIKEEISTQKTSMRKQAVKQAFEKDSMDVTREALAKSIARRTHKDEADGHGKNVMFYAQPKRS